MVSGWRLVKGWIDQCVYVWVGGWVRGELNTHHVIIGAGMSYLSIVSRVLQYARS